MNTATIIILSLAVLASLLLFIGWTQWRAFKGDIKLEESLDDSQ